MMNRNPRRVAFVALFSALLAMVSQLSLPLPGGIPLTLQTFAVALCGCVLGQGRGTVAVLVWLLLGAVGLPVFSGFQGGMASLLGPSGGFLVGFVPFCFCCGAGGLQRPASYAILSLCGLGLCHFFGVAWFSVFTARPFFSAFLISSLPYLVKDILSLWGAWGCTRALRRDLPSMFQ